MTEETVNDYRLIIDELKGLSLKELADRIMKATDNLSVFEHFNFFNIKTDKGKDSRNLLFRKLYELFDKGNKVLNYEALKDGLLPDDFKIPDLDPSSFLKGLRINCLIDAKLKLENVEGKSVYTTNYTLNDFCNWYMGATLVREGLSKDKDDLKSYLNWAFRIYSPMDRTDEEISSDVEELLKPYKK